MPKQSRPRCRVDELPERGAIELLRIVRLDSSRFRLDFRDDLELPSFVLECRGNRIVLGRAFSEFGRGRSCCDQALRALDRFARGEPVEFPIEMEMDGGMAPAG